MILVHSRYATASESTASRLLCLSEIVCKLLEDQYQPGVKIPGETCIPTGWYDVTLRTDTGMAAKHAKRFPWFRGLPCLTWEPSQGEMPHPFTDLRVHPGNTDDDTLGCPLTAMGLALQPDGNWKTQASAEAYKRLCVSYLYPTILGRGESVLWHVTDHEMRL